MVPAVGQGRDNDLAVTKKALLDLGKRIDYSGAETLVMITPHGTVFRDGIGINGVEELEGDLSSFGAPQVKFTLSNDLSYAHAIKSSAEKTGVTAALINASAAARYGVPTTLDHGITAPLYFLREAGVDIPLVHISMGLLPRLKLYDFGVALREAAWDLDKRVAVVASSDLSHRLTPDAPNGYHAAGKEFDELLVSLTGAGDVEGICALDEELTENAGECGLRAIIMMLGALDGSEIKSEVLSYEGPFGVGYLVASLRPGAKNISRRFQDKLAYAALDKLDKKRALESLPVRLAREVLEHYYNGQKEHLYDIAQVPQELSGCRAGVFVSLKKHGQLRGCIGTISPVQNSIAEEIAANAVSAAVRDPRFNPVVRAELRELDISVDIMAEPEPVADITELDPKRYGVIVSSGSRRGLLLPDLEGIDTSAEQVAAAKQKAGLEPHEKVNLERFEVVRYK